MKIWIIGACLAVFAAVTQAALKPDISGPAHRANIARIAELRDKLKNITITNSERDEVLRRMADHILGDDPS